MEWYENEEFVALQEDFASDFPEGASSDSCRRMLFKAYHLGVKDGRNGTSCL